MRTVPRRAVMACALVLACAACSSPAGRGSATYGGSPTPTPTPTQAVPSPSGTTDTASGDSPGLGITVAPDGTQAFADGVARVMVQSVDTAQQQALVIVTCGRTVSANKPVAPGFYRVDLHNAVFEMSSNPADPSTGHVSDIPLAQWAQLTGTRHNWNLFVRREGTTVSDGPTYDICTNAN